MPVAVHLTGLLDANVIAGTYAALHFEPNLQLHPNLRPKAIAEHGARAVAIARHFKPKSCVMDSSSWS